MYAVFYSAEILRKSRFASGIRPNQTYRILMVIIESMKVPMFIPKNPSSLSLSVNQAKVNTLVRKTPIKPLIPIIAAESFAASEVYSISEL